MPDVSAEINIIRSQMLELSDRLDSLEKVRDQEVEQIPPLEDDPGVPRVGNVQLLGSSGSGQLDEVVIGFEEPRDHPNATNVEAYELYMKGTTSIASEFALVSEATKSPFVLPITSNITGVVTVVVRTRMKGGLGTPVETSPSLAIDITALNAAIAAGSITSTELADGAVTEQKIANLAVTNAKIANAAISTAKIQNAAITTALIANAAITNALIANATIDAAKINSVAANTIQAGTISAAISMTSPNITSTSGSNSVNLSNGRVTISGPSFTQELTAGQWNVGSNIFSSEFQCTGETLTALDRNGLGILAMDGGANNGFQGFYVYAGGFGSERASIRAGASNGALFINGTQVVTNRQATVSDPSGGGTQDTEARTAINAIIDRLQAHGLIS